MTSESATGTDLDRAPLGLDGVPGTKSSPLDGPLQAEIDAIAMVQANQRLVGAKRPIIRPIKRKKGLFSVPPGKPLEALLLLRQDIHASQAGDRDPLNLPFAW